VSHNGTSAKFARVYLGKISDQKYFPDIPVGTPDFPRGSLNVSDNSEAQMLPLNFSY
jgi:hypothetical protein